MKLQRKDLMIAGGTTLVGGLLVMQLLLPGLRQAQQERQTLEGEIVQLQATVASLPSEQERERRLKAEYEGLRLSLPDNEAFDEVLADLQDAANALGVQTGRISRTVQPSDIAGVSAVKLDMQVSGTYARIQALIQTIARLPRAYTAEGINLNAAESGTVGGSLKLTTYKRESATPTAKPTPATPTENAATPPASGGTP